MKKFNMFFDIEKEEAWLNEQLQKGYRCTKISRWGVYTFKQTDKEYVIRLDNQDYLTKEKLREYKGIYEDFGWEHIKGYWFSGIQYWQNEAVNQTEIFSDRQSKASYYKRLMRYSFMLVLLGSLSSSQIYKDFGLYHDGLWNMEGALFWKAFIFETPFVLVKLLPAMMVALFGASFYKAYRKYSKLKE